MKGTLNDPPKLCLTMETMGEAVKQLFPTHEKVTFNCVKFTIEKPEATRVLHKSNKAAGRRSIPPDTIKYVAASKPKYVLSIYNDLGRQGSFPSEWKTAKTLLLKKDNTSFSPICLFDVDGKLYEHLILGRLNFKLIRTGELSDKQYGYRKGKQINAVTGIVN